MKNISVLLLIIFFSGCQNDLTTKKIKEKANRIRIELLNNKSLPAAIQESHDVSSVPSGKRSFMYNTTRKENNSVDSVLMTVTVHIDSLEHIDFYEMHLINDNEDRSYMYMINKYGVIDWAYRTESEPKVIRDDKGKMIGITSSDIIVINTDSSHNPIKKPDEKTLAMYTARLKASLEELDKMLSAK